MKKVSVLLEVICYAFIVLFLYTALSKLYIFNVFVNDLRRSPLISSYAPVLSVILPLSEILIAVLLFFPSTQRKGLYGALGLMVAFTIYVGYIVLFKTSADWPCSCGGLIRQLRWPDHFVFNIFFTLLAVLGIRLNHRAHRMKIIETQTIA